MRAEQYPTVLGACVLWTGSTNRGGYGQRRFKGKLMSAHRAAMMEAGHDIAGRDVLHRCDERCCINIDHLYLGDNSDNMIDKSMRGPRSSKLKLTPEDVTQIRSMLSAGKTQRSIAKQFGVDQATVSNIKRGVNWSHHKEDSCH